MRKTFGLIALAAVCAGAAHAADRDAPPAAIWRDPPVNHAYPASGAGIQFQSGGAVVNGMLYLPAGAGAHPTVILLHGLPGNEQNLDLARGLQRAGWTVITFHYRGSWGSGGAFRLTNSVDDVHALLSVLRQPEKARAWGVETDRIVIIGHSYGGLVAAAAMAAEPDIKAGVLIAPWDASLDARDWSKLPPEGRKTAAIAAFDDVDGRLTDANAVSLGEEVVAQGDRLDLARTAPAIAGRPLLIITATRDSPDDQAVDLLRALRHAGADKMRSLTVDTDHGFNDHRIALITDVLRWLAPFSR